MGDATFGSAIRTQGSAILPSTSECTSIQQCPCLDMINLLLQGMLKIETTLAIALNRDITGNMIFIPSLSSGGPAALAPLLWEAEQWLQPSQATIPAEEAGAL